MKVYIRKKLRKPKNGKKYVFIHAKNKKNTVRHIFHGYQKWLIIFGFLQLGAKPEHASMDYYLGGTDSCQGDSGGPLFKFISKKIKN